MSARPTVAEERWLAVAARLRGSIARDALASRTGGWRTTGPIARVALFVAGLVVASLVCGIVMIGGGTGAGTALFAGLVIVAGAEALIRGEKLFQSGIAEGAFAAGGVLLAFWLHERIAGEAFDDTVWLFGAVALIGSGLRVANSVVTTIGVALVCGWIATTVGDRVDGLLGFGATATLAACLFASGALYAGARTYRRPSDDRTFDVLVAGLPLGLLLLGGRLWSWPSTFYEAVPARASPTVTIVLLAYAGLAAVVGLRRRRHAPLYGALFAAAAGIAHARAVIGGPDEAWLVGVGLATLVAAVALERRLREPRDGLTSTRLSASEGPADLVQLAGVTTLHAPGSDAGPPSHYEGGGGRYGGGGASGSF